MSEMTSLQNIRCTAVRQHKHRPKSTFKIWDLEEFQKNYFSPFTQAAFREHSDDMQIPELGSRMGSDLMKHLFVIQQCSYFIKLDKAKKNGLEANAPCHNYFGPNRLLSQQSISSGWVQILPCQNLWQIQTSSPSLCSSSVLWVKFITKSLITKWRANTGRFLFLVWNLIWNFKVKSKFMSLPWRFPRLFRCFATNDLCSHFCECKIIMTMSKQLIDPRNERHIWLQHLRQYYHNMC